jgi:hypothetical protein
MVSRLRPHDYVIVSLALFFLFVSGLNYFGAGPPRDSEAIPFFALALVALAALLIGSIYLTSRDSKIMIIIVLVSALLGTYGAEIYVARQIYHLKVAQPGVATAVAAQMGQQDPAPQHSWRSFMMGRQESATLSSIIKAANGKPVDTRPKIEVIDDLVAQGIQRVVPLGLYPLFQSSKGAVQPLAGPSHSHAVVCNESGEWISLNLDRHGFNNASDVVWQAPIDIAFVGASTVFGLCVPAGQNLVDQLRPSWPKTLNLGYIGSGPISFVRRMYEYLPDLKPKVVLFEYNDWLHSNLDREGYHWYRFSEKSLAYNQIGMADLQDEVDQAIFKDIKLAQKQNRAQLSSLRNAIVPWFPDQWHGVLSLSSLRKSISLEGALRPTRPTPTQIDAPSTITAEKSPARPWEDVPLSPDELAKMPEASPENLKKLRLVLDSANEFVASWGGQLVFVYLPLMPHGDLHMRAGFTLHDRIIGVATAAGIPVIDLQYAFHDQPDPWSFFPPTGDGHYATRGHKFIGEKIVEAIRTRGFLPAAAAESAE